MSGEVKISAGEVNVLVKFEMKLLLFGEGRINERVEEYGRLIYTDSKGGG